MRLRVTVRRHGLPETPILWSIDTRSAPTVYQLLEQINEIVPIESDGQWGLEDYAVDLKGANGANYECLHFQLVDDVLKEEDELIIRPLLTQDLRVRRISGRHQISDDGKRLYDGLALGRPLLRTPSRPATNIPPRKKRRITYSVDEDDDEGLAALPAAENGEAVQQQLLLGADLKDEDDEDDEDFAPGEDDSDATEGSDTDGEGDAENNQLVVHADAEDDDSEDGEEFAPEADEDMDEDEDDDDDEEDDEEDGEEDGEDDDNKQVVVHTDFDNADSGSGSTDDEDVVSEDDADGEQDDYDFEQFEDEDVGPEQEKYREYQTETLEDSDTIEAATISDLHDREVNDLDEPALRDISDPETRAKIRQLHSAFPNSHLALCKYILNDKGVEGDVGEAYEVLARGFHSVKPKSEITENSQGHGEVLARKTRHKSRLNSRSKSNSPAIEEAEVEANEGPNEIFRHYDQHGLPRGSIMSGKALSFMAKVARSSPARNATSAESALGSKLIKFHEEEEELSNGSTSTPVINRESRQVDSSEDDSDYSEKAESSGDCSDSDDSSYEDGSSRSNSSDSSSGDEEMADLVASSSSEISSDSSSDSSSDDDAPEVESSRTKSHAVVRPASPIAETSPKCRLQSRPGQGKSSTRSRNTRRRNANLLARYKAKGILPAATTLAELSQLRLNANSTPEEAVAALEALKASRVSNEADENREIPSETIKAPTKVNEEFERRRAELLSSLAGGGVEVGTETPKKTRKAAASAPTPKASSVLASPIQARHKGIEVEQATTPLSIETETHNPSLISKVFKMTSNMTENEEPRPSTSREPPKETEISIQSPIKPQPAPENSIQTAPRRSRLDLGAGRRMLFGALGLKTPKTKTDEEKLKKDLMKDVRPLITRKPVEEPEVVEEEVDEDPEAWRNKIIYRAVECVQEDIFELSQPPFPFVQRWDPQQRGTRPQKGKRKNYQQDQIQNYEEEPRVSKKQKRRKGRAHAGEQEYLEASYEPSFQENSGMVSRFDDSSQTPSQNHKVDEKVNQPIMNGIQVPTEEDNQTKTDLPALPEDLSALPALHDGMAEVGMIIAFKHLEMCNWQPLLSNYVTAEITFVDGKGELSLLMAERDRKVIEKTYDQITGNRVYARFEAPDDDETGQEDEGMLYLSFSELVEPKILQQAPAGVEKESQEGQETLYPDVDMDEPPENNQADPIIIDDAILAKKAQSADESATLSHEQELPENNEEEEPLEAQYSHVTETPLNSDASDSYQQDRQPAEDLEMLEPSLPQRSQRISASSPQADPSVSPPIDDMAVEAPLAQERPATPGFRGIDESPPDIDILNGSVPEETKQKLARMKQDAGFRPNIQSSISRGPDGIQTPGEAASFEKLRNEMIGTQTKGDKESQSQSLPYSPKFNGLGSSPIRKPRESSQTPTKAQQPAPDASSPTRPPSSSWETVDGEHSSSPPSWLSPELEGEGHSSWITIDQTQSHVQHLSSPPVFESSPAAEENPSAPAQPVTSQDPDQANPQSSHLEPAMGDSEEPANLTPAQVPICKAQAYWLQWQANKRGNPQDSDLEYEDDKTSTRTSPERSIKSVEEKDVDASVKYPEISLGSSFPSQVTDHGHQCDADFDDAVENMDSPAMPNIENRTRTPLDHTPNPDREHGQSKDKGKGKATDTEAQLAATKSASHSMRAPTNKPAIPTDDSSSDDKFPSLEVLSQRSATIKREKVASLESDKSAMIDADYKKAMAVLDEETSHDQETPKASQKQRQGSTSRSSKSRASGSHAPERRAPQHSRSRASERPASQSRTSMPRASQLHSSQSIPAGLQFLDLTLSSDAEQDPDSEPTHVGKTFRAYNLNSDDEDFQGSPGVQNKGSAVTAAPRQDSSVSLGSSSATTLNARNRRQSTNE